MFNTADPTQWIMVFAILFALTFIAATAFAYSLFWYFHEKETARDEYPEAVFGLERSRSKYTPYNETLTKGPRHAEAHYHADPYGP